MGKPVLLEKYQKSNQFQKLITISLDLYANKGNIIDAGQQLMLSITGPTKKKKAIKKKRLADCYKKLGGKSAVKPESFGRTSDATAKC